MKQQIINIDYFKNEFGYKGVDDEEIQDDRIEYFIKRATSRVNTITSNYFDKQIRAKNFIDNAGSIEVDPTKYKDANELYEEQQKLEALKEATALLTNFGINTGYDFLTGSFSMSLGSESYSDSIDFENSLRIVETNIKELLANHNFNDVLLQAGSMTVGFNDPQDDGTADWIYSNNKELTEQGLINRLIDTNWTTTSGGITIKAKDVTQPSKGIIVDVKGHSATVKVDDTEITEAEANYG